ncbi:hypothetical protein C2G38_2188978 [Gigaspora rosea]|uniref:Uncharacterized protein n=1 Tax=Gigaspora rosea TaxID=44941 RepID=A0A397V792_9GLOM|nr:hypothetical protein C2G38_2188978 [Gigaspora rosea]
MPCFATTVVKISQVRLYVKDEINLEVVWAIRNYSIEQETNISEKIVPEIYRGIKRVKMTISTSTCVSINKIPDSNNCPMRVLVVSIVQNEVETVLNDENAAVKFLLFVVGKLEIIKDNICIYTKDINYVETHVEVKKQVFDSNNSQTLTTSSTSSRSKLLATYRSIAENSRNVPRSLTSANTVNLDDFELDKSEVLLSNSRPAKRAKSKNVNKIAKNLLGVDNLEFAEVNDYKSEAPKDYDTTNEYFDETRDSDIKDEEESSDDSFYTKNMRNKSRGHGRGCGHGRGRSNSRGHRNKGKEHEV